MSIALEALHETEELLATGYFTLPRSPGNYPVLYLDAALKYIEDNGLAYHVDIDLKNADGANEGFLSLRLSPWTGMWMPLTPEKKHTDYVLRFFFSNEDDLIRFKLWWG